MKRVAWGLWCVGIGVVLRGHGWPEIALGCLLITIGYGYLVVYTKGRIQDGRSV